ncbi:MAG: YHS domain-containing (seleno)protein [Pseudomonadota bacterium]
MTAQRQENKGERLKIASLAAIAGLFFGLACPALKAVAASTERVVVNRNTGLAIDGFDPVAYFTDKEALPGRADFEASDQGAIWRFRNAGNRTAFLERPEIYGPRFGGYDPTDVARGKPVPGRAQIWLIRNERLYLFNREESRDAFAAASDRILDEANAKWPSLSATLSSY